MCRISRDTVKKATQRTMTSYSFLEPSKTSRGVITLSVNYRGGSYKNSVSMSKVKEAYGRALTVTEKK